ncbi:oxidoreductase [Agromyces humatus]|uniref:Clp ATPase C-terminal domain-containing protein n=1 Tax=Agromyces humatus TaxID=279573 RepID=A0ABP4WG88_9MICO
MTGASSGIGEQTALELLRRGFTVYGAARRVDRMSALVDAGGHAIAMDVTDDASVRAAVDRIDSEQGRIDVLVNNAGYGSYGALEDVPIGEARRQFEVNVFGLARITQLVLPGMRARRSGAIVNISSIGGRIYEPLGAWYHATKFAVEGLSDSLRVELEPHGIRVVVIQPGAIRTEWNGISRRSAARLSAREVTFEVTDAAVALLAERGYEPEYGARPLRRVIQREIDDRISDLFVSGALGDGEGVRVDAAGGEFVVAPVPRATVSLAA